MGRQERVVLMLLEAWQQSLQGRLYLADRADRDRMSPPDMRGVDVDLNDLCLARIELRPREIRPEQQQHIAVENGVIASGLADDPRHADVVRIVILDEVLAA